MHFMIIVVELLDLFGLDLLSNEVTRLDFNFH